MKIFYGGNVNIGRRMNRYANEFEQFKNMPTMRKADFRLVNLTCVTATCNNNMPNKCDNNKTEQSMAERLCQFYKTACTVLK